MKVRLWGKLLIFSLVLVAGFALLDTRALAFSPQLSLLELAHYADFALVGCVEDVQASFGQDGLIHSQVTVKVERLITGSLEPRRIVVTVPGGVVGDVGLWVSDAPQFAPGDEALMFLAGGPEVRLVGGLGGAHRVRDGELVGSGVRLDQIEQALGIARTRDLVGNGIRSDRFERSLASARTYDQALLARMSPSLASVSLGADPSFVWEGGKWASPGAMGEPFHINDSRAGCSGAIAAVQAAALSWSQVPGADFAFSYGGTTWRSAPSQDGYNTVAWVSLGPYPAPLGMAYEWYSVPDMIYFEADAVLNADYAWSTTPTCPVGYSDVQNVASHELGHWTGLKDLNTTVDSEETMYGGSHLSETRKRTLEPDDEDGLRAIYPEAQVVSPGEWGTPGSWQVFTATYTSDIGWESIRHADFLVAAATDAQKAVHARYDVQQDKLYLRNPAGGSWLPLAGRAPGEAGLIKHVYGQLDAEHTVVEATGDVLVVKWALLFTWRMSGASHLLHLATEEADGTRADWQSYGVWSVNRTPMLTPPELNQTVVPIGDKLTFTPRYKDLDGRETIAELYFVIADDEPRPGVPIAEAVYIKYDNTTGQIYLRDRTDTSWIPANGATPQTTFVVGNGLVNVYGPGTRIINADSKTFRPMWVLSFEASFRGRHEVFMRAVDHLGGLLGGDTGWKWKGWLEVR